jgi:hypothetical protein
VVEAFKLDIEQIRSVGDAVADDTGHLRTASGAQIDQIDRTCRALPPTGYQYIAIQLDEIRGMLNRTFDSRDRISDALRQAAAVAEQTERRLAGLFG